MEAEIEAEGREDALRSARAEAEAEAEITPSEEETSSREEEDIDPITTQWDQIVAAARRPGTGIPMRKHRGRNQHYCKGLEVVEWLAQHEKVTPEKVAQLAQKLLDKRIIVPIKSTDLPTIEPTAFYCFSERRHVVVVGGGFAGRHVATKLQSAFRVTMVDTKGHFLSLPSIPACVCDTDHLASVTAPLTKYLGQCEVVVDELTGIRTDANTVQLKSGGSLAYDYLVLCTGSRYLMPIQSNDQLVVIDPLRPDSLRDHYEALSQAESVAVIGAGPVGIEIVGEILHYFPEKRLNVIYSGKKMLERCCKGAHKNIKKNLKASSNVHIYKDQKVVGTDGDQLLTSKGESVRADVAYCCVGFVPNTEFLRAECAEMLSERGFVKVNEFLQVEGHPNIFALGDIADINEEKLAQNAEKHAGVAIKNIRAMERGKELRPYKSGTRFLIVSLGPKRAMFIRGDKVYIENALAAKLKSMVEHKIMKG